MLEEIADLKVQDKNAERNAQTFIEAGFTVENIDGTVVYTRPVSNDVREASRILVQKRTIGYRSKDISGSKKKRA